MYEPLTAWRSKPEPQNQPQNQQNQQNQNPPALTLELFEPSLQLVVVEGGLTREPGSRAGPPDGAEAGARPPAGAGGVGRAGGQGPGVVQGRGEGPGESAGGALKLHEGRLRGAEASRRRSEERRKVSESFSSIQDSRAASGEVPTVSRGIKETSRAESDVKRNLSCNNPRLRLPVLLPEHFQQDEPELQPLGASAALQHNSLAQQTHRGGSIMLLFSIHLSLSSHLPSIQESTHPPTEEEHKEEEEEEEEEEVKNERVGLSSCSSSSSSDAHTLKTVKTPFRRRESRGGRGRSRGSVSSQRPITGLHPRGDVINVCIRGGEGGGREREGEREGVELVLLTLETESDRIRS